MKSNRVKRRRNSKVREVLKELQAMEHRIISRINSTKRSIEYDLNKKLEDLKNTIIVQNNIRGASITEAKSTLDKDIPLKDIEEFKEFDENLIDNDNKQNALVSI